MFGFIINNVAVNVLIQSEKVCRKKTGEIVASENETEKGDQIHLDNNIHTTATPIRGQRRHILSVF